MDTFMSMSENGWNGWQTEGGRLLPIGESAIAPADPSDYFAGGEGTQADPYRIATAAQLSGFAAATQASQARHAPICISSWMRTSRSRMRGRRSIILPVPLTAMDTPFPV